jgi:hypothetical protein
MASANRGLRRAHSSSSDLQQYCVTDVHVATLDLPTVDDRIVNAALADQIGNGNSNRRGVRTNYTAMTHRGSSECQ